MEIRSQSKSLRINQVKMPKLNCSNKVQTMEV